jgi:hypothetical protein
MLKVKSVEPPIEKGIEIPPRPARGKAKTIKIYYPFPRMEVGDSFYIASTSSVKVLKALWKSKNDGHTPKDWTFETRGIENGVRCWRTS